MSQLKIQSEIIDVCEKLHDKNVLSAADGNISCKVSVSEILMTPTGINKTRIKPRDLAVITEQNQILSGQPSSERLMHLEIYQRCPKARAVVHAHPPLAVAWTIAHPEMREFPLECLAEGILAVGRIPIAPYARPGTADMGECLREFLPHCRVIVLSRHGAVSWGEDLDEAYNGIERLEHICTILKGSVELGGLSALPEQEVEILRQMRARLGERTL